MAHPSRAPSDIPRPAEARESDVRVPLRLTVARGKLGLELYEPLELGPLQVSRLGVTLPGLRFPVDLSGGVRLFRHRRGALEHLEVSLSLDRLGKWLERRLREMLGGLVRPPSVWPVEDGLGIGLVGTRGAIAFDAIWAPVEGDARFVVARARGAELDAPALVYALQAVDTALGKVLSRSGRTFGIERLAATLTRATLPSVGARAPSSPRACASSLTWDGDVATVVLDATAPPPGLSSDALRALELSQLTREADDALVRGDLETARAAYVGALERAPRHPEVSRIIAEIDATHGDRAEAALALLAESLAPVDAGPIGASLLARVGDVDAAVEALRGAAHGEVYAPLVALLWTALAAVEKGAPARLGALDSAVASCPGLSRVRWARFEARLEAGDVGAALADSEHLEAAASGSRARHEVLSTAAARLLALGYVRDAGRLFERALRYAPDDPSAAAGLGRALLEAGRVDRAVALLERAVVLGDARGAPQDRARVDLARTLAKLGDLPQAIARVREVRPPSSDSHEARALEAKWRDEIGDVSGATLAYGRLREGIELGPPGDVGRAVEWLRTAAHFERVQGDAVAAERHLAVALRLAPRDRRLAEEYREMAALVQARARRDERDSR